MVQRIASILIGVWLAAPPRAEFPVRAILSPTDPVFVAVILDPSFQGC
jgi:hypothetical protein